MSTPDNNPLGALDDHALAARLAALERAVAELRDARGEVGLRIRAIYVEALNAARLEAARRGRKTKGASHENF